MKKIVLDEKFSLFSELWTPKIIARAGDQLIKLARGEGELVWHSHENEDELFLVFTGSLTIKMRAESVTLGPGELFVVPRGVEHCPRATKGTRFMMIEPASTAHTGSTRSDITVEIEQQEWI